MWLLTEVEFDIFFAAQIKQPNSSNVLKQYLTSRLLFLNY